MKGSSLKAVFAAALICSLAGTAGAQALGIFSGQSDIGDVSAKGNAKIENNEYVVQGSGADIWNAADEFYYVYKEITGAFKIKGTVFVDVGGGDTTWAKAGLMVRDSLDAGSAYGFSMIRNSGQDYTSQWRLTTDGSASGNDNLIGGQNGTYVQDGELELERLGSTLNFYYLDVATQERVLAQSITVTNLADPVYVGLAVTSHNDGQFSTGYFSDVALEEYPWSIEQIIPVTSYAVSQLIEGIQLKVSIRSGQSVSKLTVKETIPSGLSIVNLKAAAGDAKIENDQIVWTLTNQSTDTVLSFDLQAPTKAGFGTIELNGEASDGTLTIPVAGSIPQMRFNIYETFSYPLENPGTDITVTDPKQGVGWASNWAAAGANAKNSLDETILTAGLVETQPAEYNPGGFSLKVPAGGSNGVGRKFTTVSVGELWLSFVFKDEGPAANHWAGITLYDSSGTESNFVGKPNNSAYAGIGNLPKGDSLTTVDYKVANHYLVRYVLDNSGGQKDSVYLWINPDSEDRLDTYDAGGPDNDEIKDISEIRLRRGDGSGSSYFDTIWISSDPALPPAGAGRVDLTFNDPDRDPSIPVWDVVSIDQYDDGITGVTGFGHDNGNNYYLVVAGYLYYDSAGTAYVANGLPPDHMSGLNGHILGPYNDQYLDLGLKNSVKFMNNTAQKGPFTFNMVPAGKYSEIRSAMTIGNGYGVLKCTLNYEDGTTEVTDIRGDDWFRDPTDADWQWDDVTLLIDGMDRLDGSSLFADANDPAVNECSSPVNSDKVLKSVTLELDTARSGNSGNVGFNLYDIWAYPAGGGTGVADWSLF